MEFGDIIHVKSLAITIASMGPVYYILLLTDPALLCF